MDNALWSVEEEAIIVYYTSRNVCCQACVELLGLKCNTEREVVAIQEKLSDFRNRHTDLYDRTKNRWKVEAVNMWLREQIIKDMDGLFMLYQEEVRIIRKVGLTILATARIH